jgi:hypothetical protein
MICSFIGPILWSILNSAQIEEKRLFFFFMRAIKTNRLLFLVFCIFYTKKFLKYCAKI